MKDYEKKYNVFQSALEIPEPWYFFHHELDKKERTLHVYIEYFSCSNCGAPGCKVHDTQDQDQTWRHLDFWQYRTILHARMPRVSCELCGKIRTVIIDWEKPGAGLSLLFENHLMSLMVDMPVAAVARKVGEHDTRLWRYLNIMLTKR